MDNEAPSMAVPPEVVFSRFFQDHFPYIAPVRPEDPDSRLFRGRYDLSGLPPGLQEQLRGIQETFNEALRNEKQNVAEHVDHPPFHVDYVVSDSKNAIAFRYGGYSFIAITTPLIHAISDVCLLLSKSATVCVSCGVHPSDKEYNELHAVLFYILTAFVVSHEYTHHVHGHVCDAGTIFPNEILDAGANGSMDGQIREVDADGYAAYHVLANLIDSPTKPPLLALLKLDAELPSLQDEVLFALVVVAMGAYLFMRPAPDSNRIDIYKETHPPQAVRMDFFMRQAIGWCRQNRPELEAWIKRRFQSLMSAALHATLGNRGLQVWGEQSAFFKTEKGVAYIKALADGTDAYKQSL